MITRLRCGLLLALALEAAPALAFDPFEIQVYDGSIDERHQAGLELHVNRPRDGPLHLTLEPSFGLTDFWELGGYFQTADGRYEGVKLRTKLALPLGRFRAGVNFELSRIPDEGWGGEIRPILAFENERFLLAMNPIVSFPAAFEPAAMAKLKLGLVGLGLEYYATVTPPPREQYLFEAVDLFGVKDVEVNAAVGQGFGAANGQLVFKSILGYAF